MTIVLKCYLPKKHALSSTMTLKNKTCEEFWLQMTNKKTTKTNKQTNKQKKKKKNKHLTVHQTGKFRHSEGHS